MSCGVNSPNSLATIPGTVNLNANLSTACFTCMNRLITYHRVTFRFLNSSSLGSKKIHQFLVLATCLPLTVLPGRPSPPQRPRPGLLQLALLLQDNGQVVHRDERVRVLGSQLGLAAFQGLAVQPFSLAARDGVLRW